MNDDVVALGDVVIHVLAAGIGAADDVVAVAMMQ